MDKAESAAMMMVEPNSDFPSNSRSRRLNFTANCNDSVNVILPEHPQARLQSKLVALAKAQAQSQRPPAAQRQRVKPPLQDPLRPKPVTQRVQPVALPQPSKPISQVLKADTPNSGPSCKVEVKGGTPKKQRRCNCKNSLCLKLYCECFASGISCDGCNCTNCHNNSENEVARQEAVEATLERSRKSFRLKNASPHISHDVREETGDIVLLGRKNKGCHCKKSGCLKRYCECFQSGIMCSENCKCVDCKNFDGSDERKAIFCDGQADVNSSIQHAANAAINGSIDNCGFDSNISIKKRKLHQVDCGATTNFQSHDRSAGLQEEKFKACASSSTSSSLSSTHEFGAVMPTKLRNSNFRSLLADVIRPHDVNALCSLLVEVSGEAVKTYAEKNNMMNEQTKTEISGALGIEHNENGQNEFKAPQTSGDHSEVSEIYNCNETNEMALSPRTLSLMCDEDDVILTAERENNSHQGNNIYLNEVYADQEKLILTRLWDCLNRIVVCGSIKESTRLHG